MFVVKTTLPNSFSFTNFVPSLNFIRNYSQPTGKETLKERVAQLIPVKLAQVKKIKQEHGDKILGTCTVNQAYGGMRAVKSLLTETSLLDPEEGIRFRNYTIPECQKLLPKASGGQEPLPEGLLWLLMTGEIPTENQVKILSKDLSNRGKKLPEHVEKLIANFPRTMHPMTQFVAAVTTLQTESLFAKAYAEGVPKTKYWETTFEDSLNLIAVLPLVAASIYRHTYHKGVLLPYRSDLDYGANFSELLGYNSAQFHELLRLYLVIHSDHEGGNVSAHTTHLVGSALSDPYLSLSAGMAGLAGPLHGLANQEVLRWIKGLQAKLGTTPLTKEKLEAAIWETLNAGQVIPGYGHAVLRKTDPRYTCQREFAMKWLRTDPLFQLVSTLYEVVPGVLTKQGKTKNPYPNVDAHSGVLLQYFGLKEENYYTVLFGVSRAFGVLSSLVWDRALSFPLERPKSVTSDWIQKEMANPNGPSKDGDE